VLRSGKDNKKPDDEDEEEMRDKSLWEMWQEFMQDNKNRQRAGGLLLALLLGAWLLEETHELLGVEFGLYRCLHIDVAPADPGARAGGQER
jgi:hypothetical protein